VAFERQREIEEEHRVIVGVNAFEDEEDLEIDLQEVTEEDANRQIQRLERVKRERDDKAVEAALDALHEAVTGGENVMPYIINAVKTYATVGEISDVLRTIFGTYEPRAAV
jgi:methylmalonyl-CoA mutase N-terminal domain/subunit